jgi:hypothetical protein
MTRVTPKSMSSTTEGSVRPNSKPFQIRLNRFGVFCPRAFEIRIVEAQDERPAVATGEEPVEECSAGVADMDAPGGRRREPDDRKGGHPPS